MAEVTTEEGKVSELEMALETERNAYTKKMSSLLSMIGDIAKISESQVLMLSYRHMLVDKLIKYRAAVFKKKANDLNYRKLRYEYYKTAHNIRLESREIREFIDSDMALRSRQTDLLENQINFCSQSIDTLDKMGFAIKAKIQIEEMNYRNGI
tara:strand:+ start:2421 stop:2879 length:459 start_codon:yes stop_codon:yes gene_type:complete